MPTCKCKCGQIVLNVSTPLEISRCYCFICKEIHGKIPCIFAAYNRSMIMDQIDQTYIKKIISSIVAHRGFCARCNTPIYMLYKNSSKIWLYSDLFQYDISQIDQYDIYKTYN
jgi:hypothetical protein